MEDDATWKVISGVLLIAAIALGVLWWQTGKNKVDQSVADSLRQESAELASTVDSLRAVPAETVYADPSLAPAERGVPVWTDTLRADIDALVEVLPDSYHPAYQRKIAALRETVDSIGR